MSFRRQVTPFRRYSLSPLRYKIRVILTILYSVGRIFLVFSKVSVTCAVLPSLRFLVPLKITLDILSKRNSLLFCSPRTQRIASTTLLLPDPFGPTIPMTSSLKLIIVSSAKDLKPLISKLLNRIKGVQTLTNPPKFYLICRFLIFLPVK